MKKRLISINKIRCNSRWNEYERKEPLCDVQDFLIFFSKTFLNLHYLLIFHFYFLLFLLSCFFLNFVGSDVIFILISTWLIDWLSDFHYHCHYVHYHHHYHHYYHHHYQNHYDICQSSRGIESYEYPLHLIHAPNRQITP